MTDLNEAALLRADQTRAVTDRPSQRRCAEDQRSKAWVSARTQVELRASTDGATVDYLGYASVTERDYEMYDLFGPYKEVVSRGAFADTLQMNGLDVPFVLGHDSMRRIARTTNGTLTLAEDEEGLRVEAPNLDMRDADVAYIVPKLRSGLIDEMSFKFSITSGTWSPDYTEYRINSVDLNRGDVSIVGYGASPHTAGSGLRAADYERMTDDELRRVQAKAGAVLRSRNTAPDFTRGALDRIWLETA